MNTSDFYNQTEAEFLANDGLAEAAALRQAREQEINWEPRFASLEARETLWDEYRANYVEMTEFRKPPSATERMQMQLNFGEVA